MDILIESSYIYHTMIAEPIVIRPDKKSVSLKQELKELAIKNGDSLNKYIVALLKKHVKNKKK